MDFDHEPVLDRHKPCSGDETVVERLKKHLSRIDGDETPLLQFDFFNKGEHYLLVTKKLRKASFSQLENLHTIDGVDVVDVAWSVRDRTLSVKFNSTTRAPVPVAVVGKKRSRQVQTRIMKPDSLNVMRKRVQQVLEHIPQQDKAILANIMAHTERLVWPDIPETVTAKVEPHDDDYRICVTGYEHLSLQKLKEIALSYPASVRTQEIDLENKALFIIVKSITKPVEWVFVPPGTQC